MSTKHTAGSWHVEAINARTFAILPDDIRDTMHVRIETPLDDDGTRTRADAHLMASAPDLLRERDTALRLVDELTLELRALRKERA